MFKIKGFVLTTAVVAFTALFFYSCGEKLKNDVDLDKLFDEVMKVHDDAMEKMPVLYKNRKYIQDSLINVDSVFIKDNIAVIDNADEAMGKWMSEFNGSWQTMPKEEAATYLKSELNKATSLSATIEEAIKVSNDVIANGNLPNKK